ncbi:MAG: AAC(3) family N-acetyltransferase, partial [Terracidiphilus sp.]
MKIKALMRQFVPSPARLWLRRRINELRIRRRARLRRQHIAKHGTFTAQQLIAACREAGIKPGGVLFVHCSYNDLLTYQGTPYELLEGLRELVGPSGTLLMPAYTTNMQENPCRPFDVRC